MSAAWVGVFVVAGFVVVPVFGVWGLTVWQARKFETFRRRSTFDPQLGGSANGTGVEQVPPVAADAGVLPRSPMAPVGAGDPRRPAPTGLHRRRVVVHG